MDNHIKIRTAIVLIVIAVFALAIHPLTPRDFYQTLRKTINAGDAAGIEEMIADAQRRQQERPDLLPAAAMLEAADAAGVELKTLTGMTEAVDNSDVIGMVRKRASSSIRLGLDLNGGVEFVLNLIPDGEALAAGGFTPAEAERRVRENFSEYRDLAMEALRRRLESQNIHETEITPFGSRGLSLKAPLVSRDEKDKLRKLIQMSSKLQFRLVHPRSAELLADGPAAVAMIPAGYEVMRSESGGGGAPAQFYLVSRHAEMDGRGIDRAFVVRNEFGQISIALRFNTAGGEDFAAVTGANVGRQLAVVLDGRLYCAPVIQNAIAGGQAEITGRFSLEEAQMIADALTNGSFPFRIEVAAVYDTAPTLGADNVANGIMAGLLALALLAIFMTVYYRRAGIIACIALAVNVVLILGAMAAFGATMTMPGIAGIILTLGMAVDANVLVFERMREELENGVSPQSVVPLGFRKAYSSVIDGNLTTLVVALILIYFGSGAVKGFAVSLAIGIVSSLFTALFMTRVIFDWLMRFDRKPRFTMMRFFSRPNINFLRQSKIALPLSLAAMVLSVGLCFYKGEDTLSVDFTGGTLISCSYDGSVPVAELEKSLNELGLRGKVSYKSSVSGRDNQKLEILLRDSGEERDYSGVIDEINHRHPELKLSGAQYTAVGGMVGAEMSRNAVISILLAFLGMIIYVTIRYEWSYAVAGIFALVHDAVVSLGIFVLLGREISLPVVAGVLTIIGYSINDTIVIFDRMREELRLYPERSFAESTNESLNRTLSRTVLTSLTTFLVVAVMFLFGGIAINDFVFIIMLGIVIGSYSSLYVASPLVVYWHDFINHHRRGAGKNQGEKEIENRGC